MCLWNAGNVSVWYARPPAKLIGVHPPEPKEHVSFPCYDVDDRFPFNYNDLFPPFSQPFFFFFIFSNSRKNKMGENTTTQRVCGTPSYMYLVKPCCMYNTSRATCERQEKCNIFSKYYLPTTWRISIWQNTLKKKPSQSLYVFVWGNSIGFYFAYLLVVATSPLSTANRNFFSSRLSWVICWWGRLKSSFIIPVMLWLYVQHNNIPYK